MEVLVGGSGRGDGGEYGGYSVHRKRYLRVKDSFAVRTAIPVAVVEEAIVGGTGGAGGERGGPCIHHNRCLRVKAAFLGRAKSLANTAFDARAAISSVPQRCTVHQRWCNTPIGQLDQCEQKWREEFYANEDEVIGKNTLRKFFSGGKEEFVL